MTTTHTFVTCPLCQEIDGSIVPCDTPTPEPWHVPTACADCGATDSELTITGQCNPCRTQARHQRSQQIEAQGRAYMAARVAIVAYLEIYGVPEQRANGAATDLMDDEISDIIDQEAK